MSATNSTPRPGSIPALEAIVRFGADQARSPLPSIPPGSIDMWPRPDVSELDQRQRDAVRRVLAKYEPSIVATDELVDELITAADTGI